MKRVNLQEELASFSEHWQPRVIGELNGQHVKVVKLQGEFVWHHHEHEDEMFLVVRGAMTIQLRDRSSAKRRSDQTRTLCTPRSSRTNKTFLITHLGEAKTNLFGGSTR